MWSSTEDREKAFSFHCESFEREKKNEKKKGEKKGTRPLHWFSPLQSGLLLSLFVFPSLFLSSFPHTLLSVSAFFSVFSVLFLLLLISGRQQRSGGNQRVYGEFTSPVRTWGGRGAEERRDEKQMKQGSVGSSAGSSGSVLTYPQQKEAARVMYSWGKKPQHKTPTQTGFIKASVEVLWKTLDPFVFLKAVIVWKELKLKTADKPFWVTDKCLNCSNIFPLIATIPKTGYWKLLVYMVLLGPKL